MLPGLVYSRAPVWLRTDLSLERMMPVAIKATTKPMATETARLRPKLKGNPFRSPSISYTQREANSIKASMYSPADSSSTI